MDQTVTTLIDSTKCTGCGLCIRVCLSETLSMVDGKAAVTGSESMNCGQCQAVCQVGAVTVKSLKLPTYQSFTADNRWLKPSEADLPQLVRLLGSRRSCRNFKDQPVELDLLRDLCTAATTAPSGTNSQEWRFTVITKPSTIRILGDGVTNVFEKLNRISDLKPLRCGLSLLGATTLERYHARYHEFMARLINDWRGGVKDRLFYSAPALIVISNTNEATLPIEDALLASQNLMLTAHAMGLGTCLIGFAAQALKMKRGLRSAIGLDAQETVCAVLAVGWPQIGYTSTIARRPIEIRFN